MRVNDGISNREGHVETALRKAINASSLLLQRNKGSEYHFWNSRTQRSHTTSQPHGYCQYARLNPKHHSCDSNTCHRHFHAHNPPPPNNRRKEPCYLLLSMSGSAFTWFLFTCDLGWEKRCQSCRSAPRMPRGHRQQGWKHVQTWLAQSSEVQETGTVRLVPRHDLIWERLFIH